MLLFITSIIIPNWPGKGREIKLAVGVKGWVGLQGTRGQGVGLEGPRESRSRLTGSQGVKG